MDEADILGDRIAIISHGKMRACGSSLFLKKCFGSGYYLTLVRAGNQKMATQRLGGGQPHGNECNPRSSSPDNGIGSQILTNSDPPGTTSTADRSTPCFALSRPVLPSLYVVLSVLEPTALTALHRPVHVSAVGEVVRRHVPAAAFLESVGQEITFVLPYGGAKDGTFTSLFKELDLEMARLCLTSYGISDTTLEEIFLKVAEETGVDVGLPDGARPGCRDGRGSSVIGGRPLIRRQFMALFVKRFHHARRSRKGLIAQGKERERERERVQRGRERVQRGRERVKRGSGTETGYRGRERVQRERERVQRGRERVKRGSGTETGYRGRERVQRGRERVQRGRERVQRGSGMETGYRGRERVQRGSGTETGYRGRERVILPAVSVCLCLIFSLIVPPFAEYPRLLLQPWMYGQQTTFYSQDMPRNQEALDIVSSLTDNPGFGTRCMPENPIPTLPCVQVASDWFTPHVDQSVTDLFADGNWPESNPSPSCQCSTAQRRMVLPDCPPGAGGLPPSRDNETRQFLQNLQTLLTELGAKDNVKVWFYNQAWHGVVSFLGVAHNAILRGGLPPGQEARSYGISTSNHPLNLTKSQLSYMVLAATSTNLVVSICVIFAMSFIPASFVLFLIQERVTKAKHLQFVSGVNPTIYWVANFAWDMCNYAVPCVIVILIFLCFQQEAYVSPPNLPALILLLFMYGWSITPMMYPATFLFSVPSTAYVVLTSINLFIGINGTCTHSLRRVVYLTVCVSLSHR
ncbi:hypothetical protein NHX12_013916 [Muraenolepis orangiensis]|uniref:ABC-2 type transporter transmembrane domain-containing protein n=1 Tax=Muraenolepis orangiensis TaxID=630683 RepID=A0A9Q0DB00_9TELE|nr:hypothetical protein NHX12_013916 [Muraenolepis orangiensis]